jgi:hypothetical protein
MAAMLDIEVIQGVYRRTDHGDLYRIQSRHLPGHPLTTAVLRTAKKKETHCILET